MLVGHVAVGCLAKRVERRLSLGTLVLAAMLPDLLWPVFTVAGFERVTFGPGVGAGHYFQPVDIALSHSLLTGVLWAGLLASGWYAMRRMPRAAWVLAAVVVSHWVLDVVSHPRDMPVAPGLSMRLGFGLWTSIPATILVEGGLWAIAIVVYARTTQPAGRAGVYAFWGMVPLLTVVWYNNIAGHAPENADTAPVASLVFFSLVVLWAYWVNRLRPSRARPLPGKALHADGAASGR